MGMCVCMYLIGNIKARYVPKRAILLLCRDAKIFGILRFQNNSFKARASHVYAMYKILSYEYAFEICAIPHRCYFFSVHSRVTRISTYLDQHTLTIRGCLDNIRYYNTCYIRYRHNEFAVNILFDFTFHISYTYSGTRALSALTNNYIITQYYYRLKYEVLYY